MELSVFAVFLLLVTSGVIWAYRGEKRNWNNGHCIRCSSKWRHFDTDSHGGRGYSCRCGRYLWISYPVDKQLII